MKFFIPITIYVAALATIFGLRARHNRVTEHPSQDVDEQTRTIEWGNAFLDPGFGSDVTEAETRNFHAPEIGNA